MFYDGFADIYDEMIDWEARLAQEQEHFHSLFQKHGVKRILDVACGTGMHCIMFAKMGYKVVGADNSPSMLEFAKKNATKAGVKGVKFVEGEFTTLTQSVKRPFNAIVCLGNSIPHLVNDDDIVVALREFYELLRPSGLLVIQTVHFDHYLDCSESAVAVTEGHRDGRPVTFRRHYEFKGTKLVFHVSVYDGGSRELLENYSSPINPIRRERLETFLEKVGFSDIEFFHNIAGETLTSESKSMVCLAIRPKD